MANNRYIGQYPVIGIRPIVDGRRGPMQLRESLEPQVWAMANAAKKLFEENLFYSNGEPVKVVMADTCIGRVPEAAACANKFKIGCNVFKITFIFISISFYKSVIKSRLKGVYSEINDILAGNISDEMKAKYSQVWEEIFTAKELYNLLRARRVARGSMDIESDEAYIIFDNKGKAVDIRKRERGQSEMIIEEFMLDIMYEIPKDDNIGKVTITKEYIEGTGGPIIEIRNVFMADFPVSYNLILSFNKGKGLFKKDSFILATTATIGEHALLFCSLLFRVVTYAFLMT